MLERVAHLLAEYGNWKVVLTLFVAILILRQGFVMRNNRLKEYSTQELERLKTASPAEYEAVRKLGDKAGATFDSDFRYTTADVYPRRLSFGEAGRNLYAWTEVSLDVILPLAFYPFLALLIAWAAGDDYLQNRNFQWLSLIPFVAALTDYLENFSIAALCWSYPARLNLLSALLPYFTKAKIVLIIAALLIAPLVLLVRKIF